MFIPTWANYGGKDVIVALTKEGNDEKPGTQNVGGSSDKQMIAFSGQFNYQIRSKASQCVGYAYS